MRLLPLSLSLLLIASVSVQAGEKEVRQAFQKNFAGMEITAISKTPYDGLYEVVVDGQVAYATSDGKYLVLGNVIDLASKRNLTAARNAKLMEVKWSVLPLANAINPSGMPPHSICAAAPIVGVGMSRWRLQIDP